MKIGTRQFYDVARIVTEYFQFLLKLGDRTLIRFLLDDIKSDIWWAIQDVNL